MEMLYSDLPAARGEVEGRDEKKKDGASSWAAHKMHFVPTQVRHQGIPRQRPPRPADARPVSAAAMVALGTANAAEATKSTAAVSPSLKTTRTSTSGLSGIVLGGQSESSPIFGDAVFVSPDSEEYDPQVPNNYHQVLKERDLMRRTKEAQKRAEEELLKQKEEAERRESLRKEMEEHRNAQREDREANRSYHLDVSAEEAIRRRAALSGEGDVPADRGAGDSRPVALKLMKRMGWQEGRGLGKEEQGITAPLVAQKTASHSGRIVQGQSVLFSCPTTAVPVPAYMDPSRILVLKNAVVIGEVDDGLKEECTEEASKYGNLLNVEIVECPKNADCDSVRIFLEYEEQDQAIAGRNAFHGRLFDGRLVNAEFYDEAMYSSRDLMS